MHHRTELSFVSEFRRVSPLHCLKNRWQNAVLLRCMLQAVPPFLLYYCAVVLHSCTVLPPVGHSSNYRYHCCQFTDKKAVFRIVIAILRFAFDSPLYFKYLFYEILHDDSLRIETCSNAKCLLLSWVAFDSSSCIVTARSSYLSVRLSSCISTALTDGFSWNLRKSVKKVQIWLKSDNIDQFTWILKYRLYCWRQFVTLWSFHFESVSPRCVRSITQSCSVYISIYTGCPRWNVPEFGRVFFMLNYTDITQNTCIQSWTVTEIMAREKCGLHRCRRTVRRPWRHTCPMRLPDN